MANPFAFLQPEWSNVYESATRAGASVHHDPRTAYFYARRALELAVAWAHKYDPLAQAALPGQPLRADPGQGRGFAPQCVSNCIGEHKQTALSAPSITESKIP
jgi:hypothetical protein